MLCYIKNILVFFTFIPVSTLRNDARTVSKSILVDDFSDSLKTGN